MEFVRWGILGPGAIAHNFADGMAEADNGKIAAIASRDATRRQAFGDRYEVPVESRFASYSALVESDAVDAVYISTPHVFHAELAVLAMRAGKHVLCEKPCGLNEAQVTTLTEIAAQENVLFMEAIMYRCHPQIARVLELIAENRIGKITHIKANFGFDAAFDPQSRLFDRSLAGGAVLDVGLYPISFVRLVAGAASGLPFLNPTDLRAVGRMGRSNVDEETYALLTFENGVIAECATAISKSMENTATIFGENGEIKLLDPWTPGRDAGPSDATIEITVDGDHTSEVLKHAEQLFTFEARVASQAIIDGLKEAPSPAMSFDDSIGNARACDLWRQELEFVFTVDDFAINRKIAGVSSTKVPPIAKIECAGVTLPMSPLVMGCDNKDRFEDAAIVWDAWMEAGGNAFDTAFVYGGGRHEAVLGEWIRSRNVASQIVVIGKGAHTPYCTPHGIVTHLEQSLERLGLDHVPIYIMHRDNPDIPVGEFVDVLNQLHNAGKIGIFGGSNWTPERFQEANDYANENSLEPMQVLNNNLSLAVMEKPVWPGCVTSNSPATLKYMRDNHVLHLSWSSQARGYFLPAELRDRLPEDTRPETCFGSVANEERRRRAEELAAERGVSTHNIATAWVLAQSFPSLALIGPRTVGEIASTLPGLSVRLSAAETAWLNLERESRD